MAIIFPPTLPQSFLISGYTETASKNIIKSANDAGPSKTRRRFTAAVIPITGSMIMTKAQFITFKDFVKNTLFDGALPFDMTDPVDNAIMTVKFNKPYEASFQDIIWHVTLSLDKQP